jgi:hypothetical protein
MNNLYFLSMEAYGHIMGPLLEKMASEYRGAVPFPHISIDGLFDPELLKLVEQSIPSPKDAKWWKYENTLEQKLAKDDLFDCHMAIRHLVNELQEKRFLRFLTALTGIEGLIPDPMLNGGGLHQILPGGKLDVHVDYNYHPVTRLDRRLNVILYLNSDWDPKWEGCLELWDRDMTKCVDKIPPAFNRLVIFNTTEVSNHGHPEPLACPLDRTRKSIALYYYTNGRPESERVAPHSTIFKARPGDDPSLEAFRKQRSIGRVGDLTT